MREPLVVAVVQPPCAARDTAANAAAHADAIRAVGARIVVFPELSLTGYELDAPAMTTDDAAFEPIIDACRSAGSVALVGAPVHGEHGRSHIAVVAVDESGASIAYRKLWLSSSERRRFTPGVVPARLDVDGWRLGLAVCKDTGIAQHATDTAALGIDAYVAGTLLFPHESSELNERAHRIATSQGVYVAMASFAGATGEGYDESAGRSGIWAPDGVPLDQAGTEIGEFARATLT